MLLSVSCFFRQPKNNQPAPIPSKTAAGIPTPSPALAPVLSPPEAFIDDDMAKGVVDVEVSPGVMTLLGIDADPGVEIMLLPELNWRAFVVVVAELPVLELGLWSAPVLLVILK